MVRFEFNSEDIENFYKVCRYYIDNALKERVKEVKHARLMDVKRLVLKGQSYAHTTEMKEAFRGLYEKVRSWLWD